MRGSAQVQALQNHQLVHRDNTNSSSDPETTSSHPDEAPPSYACAAAATKVKNVKPDLFSNASNQVAITLNQKSIDYGEFLSGMLYVRPRHRIPANTAFYLKLEYAAYIIRHPIGNRDCLEESEKVIRQLLKSRIRVNGDLSPGSIWRIPFNVRFPDESELPPCSCPNKSHLSAPPSIGSQHTCFLSLPKTYMALGYHLKVNTKLFSDTCVARFILRPSITSMNLTPFTDPSGNKVLSWRSELHEFASWKKVAGVPIVKKSSGNSKVQLEGWPLYLSRGLHSPTHFTIMLKDDPIMAKSSRCKIKFVKYSVKKHVFASAEKFGHEVKKENTVKRVLVTTSGILHPFEKWTGSTCQLTIPFVSALQNENISPSFVSCFTAVLYELGIQVYHNRGTSNLSVPLCLNNFQAESPPYIASSKEASSILASSVLTYPSPDSTSRNPEPIGFRCIKA